jgi:hypothetical protein
MGWGCDVCGGDENEDHTNCRLTISINELNENIIKLIECLKKRKVRV